MNPPEEEDFQTRRKDLTAQIARQRTDLSQAYLQLEKPIRYTEYGLKGFGFIRQNPWIIAAVPFAFNFASSLIGWKKGKPSPSPSSSQTQARGVLGKTQQVLSTGMRHGWNLYQLYRRVRSLIP